MNEVSIVSTGMYVPEKKLTNADLEKMVETNDEWIVSRTGIRERRIAGDMTSAEMAVRAGRACLELPGLKPDLLITSTGTHEGIYPSQSSMVAAGLGLDNLAAFDINAACSGLVTAIAVGSQFLKTGDRKTALITASEKMTLYVDYKDRASCVLFGDGASSVLLSSGGGGHRVLCTEIGTDASGAESVVMGGKGDRFFFRQEGKKVYKFAVNKIEEMVRLMMERTGTKETGSYFIVPHQANQRMFESVADTMKIPQERFVSYIDRYGNTSSSSVGIALDSAAREGRFKKGDRIFLIGFGAGLSWAAAAVEW